MADDSEDASAGLRRRFPDMHPEDWTIPPEMPVYIDPGPPVSRQEAVEAALHSSRVLAGAALMITLATIGAWAWSGHPPATDPRLGIPTLLLHLGAMYTAWRALQTSAGAWRVAESLPDEQQPRVDSLERIALSLGCDAILCTHAAMVLAAILS